MQGKHVYILAGNHDRLGNTFVFEEAKQLFEVLQTTTPLDTKGKLQFITTPTFTTIQGEPILFLPYMLPTPISYDIYEPKKSELIPIQTSIQRLAQS